MSDQSLYPNLLIPQPSAPVFQAETNSNGPLLVFNDAEPVIFSNADEFIRRLAPSANDLHVKCVSAIGNSDEDKSSILNRLFFHGKDQFGRQTRPDSSTICAWASLDDRQRTLMFDIQGQLNMTMNDNLARIRVLLKVVCLSDVVIYRTRAPKLTDEVLRSISDLSNIFVKNFQKELQNTESVSSKGPILVVFHETQYTEVLKDDPKLYITAVDKLKTLFEKANLSYSAFQSLQYVGVQTPSGQQTDFRKLKHIINESLQVNSLRSPRRLSVIFKALQSLNEKFQQAVPLDLPSILPDEFFTCSVRCLACDEKCSLPSNHVQENLPHSCRHTCIYNKQIDNEIMKCMRCTGEGFDTIVFGKLIARDDGLFQGLVRYVWSGFVIECPRHGEIYRSRKYWYGNEGPKDVTRLETIHAWPGDETNRLAGDITARRFIEIIRSAGSYISASAVPIKEKIADQLAPAYWVPNSEMQDCYFCKLQFGTEYSKHHCRACGYIFCDSCTSHRAIVPSLDSTTPERVCKDCYEKIQLKALKFQSNDNEDEEPSTNPQESELNPSNTYTIPMSRRILELVQNNIAHAAYEYPKMWINEGIRPNYWRADDECKACCVCQQPFNATTHRLHHCRRCGEGVCDGCSPNKLPVPERDWLSPERVCKTCESALTQSTVEHA